MLKTSLILPHPALSDFIHNYTLCTSASAAINMTSAWCAHHDTSLAFFLGDTPVQIKNSNIENAEESICKVCLFGLLTRYQGIIKFAGSYNQFIIEFKPTGFSKLFGIPATEIADNFFPANEVIGKCAEQLYQQLLHASGVQEMVLFADKALIGFLNRRKAIYSNNGITKISDQLLKNIHAATITQYASAANMSIRNFERRFAEQAGISPKLFCRLLRFNEAVKCKITHPDKSWIEIAYTCGYYDSMHMTKEFKQFANAGPATLFKDNPLFMEETFTTIHR